MVCFRKIPVAKKFMDMTGGGSIKNFGGTFFVSQFPKFSRENPSVLHQFWISKNVRDK